MGTLIFVIILGILFIIACMIGVVALYLALKNWAWEVMDIELPPKAKPQETYWETLEDCVTPTYMCRACNYESEWKYKYCPWCGKKMENYVVKMKER